FDIIGFSAKLTENRPPETQRTLGCEGDHLCGSYFPQLVALKKIRHGSHDCDARIEVAQRAGDPFDGGIIAYRHNHSPSVHDDHSTHHGRIGDIAIVHLVLPFLSFSQTIETQLKSDVRHARPLQHHADDPADVTVPDDNDVLMEHSAQRLER